MCYVQFSLSIVVLVVSICYNVFNQIRSGQPVQIDFELIGLAMSKEVYWAQYGLDPTLKGIKFVQCYQQWAITITIIIVFNSQVNLCCHFSFCNRRWYTLHVLIFNSKSLNSTVGTVLSFFVALYIALSRSLASLMKSNSSFASIGAIIFSCFLKTSFAIIVGLFFSLFLADINLSRRVSSFFFSWNISLSSSSATVDRHDKSQLYHT